MQLRFIILVSVFIGIGSGCYQAPEARPTGEVKRTIANRPSASTQAVLDGAEKIELISLDPTNELPESEGFRGWRILGTTILSDAGAISDTLEAIKKGIENSDGRRSACFEPRHGVRVNFGDKTVEIVICYECMNVDFYLDGQPDMSVRTITRESASLLNSLLQDAAVPLAPPAKE